MDSISIECRRFRPEEVVQRLSDLIDIGDAPTAEVEEGLEGHVGKCPEGLQSSPRLLDDGNV